MYSNNFEHAFSEFLDDPAYDRAADSLLALSRAAFAAGWRAAGGAPAQDGHIYELLKPLRSKPEHIGAEQREPSLWTDLEIE